MSIDPNKVHICSRCNREFLWDRKSRVVGFRAIDRVTQLYAFFVQHYLCSTRCAASLRVLEKRKAEWKKRAVNGEPP